MHTPPGEKESPQGSAFTTRSRSYGNRREKKFLRNDVHNADAVVWGPVWK